MWRYQVTIALTDGYYMAWLEDFGLVACSGTGNTVEEALENLQRVYENVTAHYKETNRPIPEPTRDPALMEENDAPI